MAKEKAGSLWYNLQAQGKQDSLQFHNSTLLHDNNNALNYKFMFSDSYNTTFIFFFYQRVWKFRTHHYAIFDLHNLCNK